MMEQPTEREARLAREYNQRLQRRMSKSRTASILLCVACFGVAVVVGVLGFPMLAYCAGLVALICLIQYLDANGQLHEVRRRSTKTLVPRFSVLGQDARVETPSQGQPLPQKP